MCPGVPLSLLDINIDSTDENIFISLKNILHGSSLPENVITDVDPYKYMPSSLPGRMWFLIHSIENVGTKLGFWKVKKVSSRVFPSSSITGLKTTLVFYEGHAPYARKTDWMMHEYKVIKANCDNEIAMEPNTLCRVFLSSERHPSPGRLDVRKVVFPAGENPTGRGSSNFQVCKNDKVGISVERECLPNEIQAEIDHLNWGDYIELQDLDTPLSPSESLEDSSCPTSSPDLYFDPLAFLSELEVGVSQGNIKVDRNHVSRNNATALPNFGDDITRGSNSISAEDFLVPCRPALVSESGKQKAGNNIASTSKPPD